MSSGIWPSGIWIFIALVFVAVALLAQGTLVPVVGGSRKMRKRLEARLRSVSSNSAQPSVASLLRHRYLQELSPLERAMESLPAMERLSRTIEQAGKQTPAYRYVLASCVLGAGGLVFGFATWHAWQVAAAAALIGTVAPYCYIAALRAKRLAKLEEQVPEAMDVMKRALKAGHPFNQSLKLVAEDMDAPIGREFEITFADMSYGSDARTALMALLQRVPSMALMALVTAVLVQRETGGNLAETLERISGVVRGRFKFQRRVKTLTAEGRLSAWILSLMPLALFGVLWATNPQYVERLTTHPRASTLIGVALGFGAVGVLWIRRLVRIEV